MIKAALFDCDGVLLDTESQYTALWKRVGSLFFPSVPDFAYRVKGQTLKSIMSEWVGDDAELSRRVRSELAAFEASMSYGFMPGAERFLAECRAAGVPTALVTSSATDKMEQVYRQHPHFPELFDTMVLAGDVQRSKPAPDCWLLAAERLGVPAAECVAFEDSRNGLLSARASGAYIVGLATTLPRVEVEPLADMTVGSLAELTLADVGQCRR